MNTAKQAKIIFIANGGSECGMGHIIRSLSLALAFKNIGCHIEFISKYTEGIKEIQKHGYRTHPYQNTKELLTHFIPDIIIIDSYEIDYHFLFELNQFSTTVYIDDLCTFDYPVDIILNGNITGTDMEYHKVTKNQMHLLGLEYNLIRPEFSNLPKKVTQESAKNILITTGASDPQNLTCKLLNTFLEDDFLNHLNYNVVIGSGFIYQDKIIDIASIHKNIHCFIQPKKMSAIMLQSDIAVSAGGSTLYELMACGLPTLSFIYAENQRMVVEKMADKWLTNIGYYEEIDYAKLKTQMSSLIKDHAYRTHLSSKSQGIIDGKGANRAAKQILNYHYKHKELRI